MSIAESRGMEEESSTAFDEFLRTPIMGRKKKDTDADEEQDVRDMEEGIKVNVCSHQAVTRGRRGGTPTVSTPREVSGGGGQSQEMQPQVVFGFCLLQGLRDNPMEDLHVAEVRDIDGEEVAFFGIFDAHKGEGVAKFLQDNLFNNILNEGGVRADPVGATRDAYLLTDRNILGKTSEKGGSTAVTAMVCERGSRLIVANVGDARAVMSRNGKAVQVSVDHDPRRPLERANIEARGGHVTHFPGDQWRVDGQLSVARVFGDKGLKEHISAKPDVSDFVVDLSCEFLVLGSNGLWSMYDDQEVVDTVKAVGDPVKAAHQLVLEARHRLGEDDISCIVIQFREQ